MKLPLQKVAYKASPSFWVSAALLMVMCGFGLLQFTSKNSIKKTDFDQVELSACSSGFRSARNFSCTVTYPRKPTSVSLVAEKDHEILYFGLTAKRKFSRAYRDTRHFRLEFGGKLTRENGPPSSFSSAEEISLEGPTNDWRISFPRRFVWAKDLKKRQNITIDLDFVKVYDDRKSSDFADDFANLDIFEFAIFAESDTNSLIRRIQRIKTVFFILVLAILGWVFFLSNTGQISILRAIQLVVLGLIFLAANQPFSEGKLRNTPEEYFSNRIQLELNYLTFISFEILMGFQFVYESSAGNYLSKRCLISLLGLGYFIAAYVRHAHLADYRDAAHTYSDGEARVYRQLYFKTLTRKATYISSIPCFLISLLASLFGKGFSPVSAFIAYTILSYTPERHVLANFCSWKYARDLTVWTLGYLYLSTWKEPISDVFANQNAKNEAEEETLPIATLN